MNTRQWLASTMIGVGALALASPLALHAVDQWQQSRYEAHAPHPHIIAARTQAASAANPMLAAPVIREPNIGSVVAQLSVPDLKLRTAVIQGTGDAQLLLSPGHLTTSVLPGEPGLSVVAAHNATYFRQINQLRPGDIIRVTTDQGRFTFRVTSHQIVGRNLGLPDSSAPTIALEACYPLDAMYFTPYRYVVYAALVKSALTPVSLSQAIPSGIWPYHAHIPSAISRQYPLWLSENALPMGTLKYRGASRRTLSSLVQGEIPLNITAEAIRLLEAYRYTSQHQQLAWLRWLVPSASPQADPFWGAQSVSFLAPIRLTMQLNPAGSPEALELTAPNVSIDGHPTVLRFSYDIASRRISLTHVSPSS